jgi:hypothetical protein
MNETETMTTLQSIALYGAAIAGALAALAVIAAALLRCPKCRRRHESQEEEDQCEGGCHD